ncbi:MAG TPA: DNA polymerase III subunit gamma/tau [Gammaproteobacteria bacterium]|nr:DNA polymerase III subunit gamma/tau [Gammaproteobacteria bacterium]
MNYQVLARKWRPRSFTEVVGQTPVVRALINALDQNRLHHAYLFTGTRGVGKTSLARLFSKCLNCEQGVTSKPCGQCQACQAIDQGRFLDLLEVDAASRTKVEDTRELLDNVQYAPTQGRYKIYLIDEVHMLSNHSFNALLKTLEEPPPHIKFLLATTDPQRLPITILSRCLQFHLKNLSVEQISNQLSHILDQEQIAYEPGSLPILAQAAEGSMRDALSLLDQAIAYGNGQLTTQETKLLLGRTEPELILTLLNTLIDKNIQRLLDIISELAASGADFQAVLEELLSALHQIALQQAIPDLPPRAESVWPNLQALAAQFSAEEIQLYYQIGLIGRRDLPLAPTPRGGFEMILLRMAAFKPQSFLDAFTATAKVPQSAAIANTPTATPAQPMRPTTAPQPQPAKPQVASPTTLTATVSTPAQTELPSTLSSEHWQQLLANLDLHGVAQVVASHCNLTHQTPEQIHLLLDKQHAPLLNNTITQRIKKALTDYFKKELYLQIDIGDSTQPTPAGLDKQKQEHRQANAVQSINDDAHVKTLIKEFNAQIIPNTITTKDE